MKTTYKLAKTNKETLFDGRIKYNPLNIKK